MELDKSILDAFEKAGLPLEFFTPESEDGMPMWQYDGYYDGSNVTVQLYVGLNGLGRVGVFGDYFANSNNIYSLTCNMSDWLGEYAKYLPAMKLGEDLVF
jgi:hypothetical protein